MMAGIPHECPVAGTVLSLSRNLPVPHSTTPVFEPADAARIRPVLADALAVVRSRIYRPWVRWWKSEAAEELAATRDLPRYGRARSWGEAPVSTVLPVTRMLLDAVVEHVQAVEMLLGRGGDVILAIDAETRAALEGAAQVWWLLERGVTGRQRVARLYAQRRATAVQLKMVLDKMGAAGATGYGQMPAELDQLYHSDLRLKVKRKLDDAGELRWSSSEGQRVPDYTARVRTFVRDGLRQSPEAGTYAYYCGASHSELWRILFGYTETTHPDGTVTWQRRPAAVTISMAAGVSAAALVYATARAYEYIGDGAGLAELQLRMPDLRNATRPR